MSAAQRAANAGEYFVQINGAGDGRVLMIEMRTIRAAAALIVKSEQLQSDIVSGDEVHCDQVVRLASEARRLLTGLRRKRDRKRESEQPQSLAAYLAQLSPPVAESAAEPADPSDASPAGRVAVVSGERMGGDSRAQQMSSQSRSTSDDEEDAT